MKKRGVANIVRLLNTPKPDKKTNFSRKKQNVSNSMKNSQQAWKKNCPLLTQFNTSADLFPELIDKQKKPLNQSQSTPW